MAIRRSTYAEKIVKVVPIFVIVETAAVFANLVTVGVALWFENVSWLEEDLASVLINLLEPAPQLLVPVRVVVQRIDRVLDLVHTPAVGESFEERPQLPSGLTKGGILYMNTISCSGWSSTDRVLAWATSLVSA